MQVPSDFHFDYADLDRHLDEAKVMVGDDRIATARFRLVPSRMSEAGARFFFLFSLPRRQRVWERDPEGKH